MARIAGINIPPHQHTEIGLTAIFGIGRTRARKICEVCGIAYSTKVKDLTDENLEKIRDALTLFTLEGDLRREVTINIKRLMDIGCYRGFRHRRDDRGPGGPGRQGRTAGLHFHKRGRVQGTAGNYKAVDYTGGPVSRQHRHYLGTVCRDGHGGRQ